MQETTLQPDDGLEEQSEPSEEPIAPNPADVLAAKLDAIVSGIAELRDALTAQPQRRGNSVVVTPATPRPSLRDIFKED